MRRNLTKPCLSINYYQLLFLSITMRTHLRRNIPFLYTCGCPNLLRKDAFLIFGGKGRPWMMFNKCRTYLFDHNSLWCLLGHTSGIWQKHDFLFFSVFLFSFCFFKPQVSSYQWELALPSKAEWCVTPWHALNSMAAAGFVTLCLGLTSALYCMMCWRRLVPLLADFSVFLVLWSAFFELNSSNLEVSTITVCVAIKSYSLRSLQMQWD